MQTSMFPKWYWSYFISHATTSTVELRWFHLIAWRILSVRTWSELGRFSMKTELFREINCRFVLNKLSDPTIRLYMIHPNFKNFSLFNFQIFRLIYYYILILGVSLEACKRSIRLLLLSFYGNFLAFCCNIVLLSQE